MPSEYCLSDDTHAFYAQRLEKALHRLFHPPPEGMSESSPFLANRNDIRAQVRQLLSSGLAPIAGLSDRCSDIERLDSELRELDTRLRQMSQSRASLERIQELQQRRGELNYQREQLQKQLIDLETEIGHLEAQLSELRREETNQQQVVDKAEKGQTLAALAARYRDTAKRIRELAAVQMRDQISETVGELWTEIVEREREFSGLEFDGHWHCWLIRRNGQRVTWEETNPSAGQRQVRMLAFYEALRRLARLVPPLVVDTPLARLDKEVRANVLDRLYLSGHQSLILSTNSEIDPDGPLFESVRHRLARVYTLHPHGEPDSTDYQVRVTDDYFGRDL